MLYIDTGGDKTACTQFFDARGQHAEPYALIVWFNSGILQLDRNLPCINLRT